MHVRSWILGSAFIITCLAMVAPVRQSADNIKCYFIVIHEHIAVILPFYFVCIVF